MHIDTVRIVLYNSIHLGCLSDIFHVTAVFSGFSYADPNRLC